MSKNPEYQEPKLTDASAVDDTDPVVLVERAKKWAVALWKIVHRGMDDTQEAAMHRAAKLAKVTPNTLWKMRYRPPRTVDAHVYFRLKAAYARHVVSAEATVASNLQVLRALPPTPARLRLVAQLEEYLRDQEGSEAGTTAAEEFDRADDDQTQNWR